MTNTPSRRGWTVTLAAAGTLLAAGLVLAGPASAHVRVSGTDTTQGGYGLVTFRVPTESTTASTTELLITFPSDTPFTSASLQPKSGWTGKVVTKKLASPQKGGEGAEIDSFVYQVDYKADSAASAIPPGEFDLFTVSVGPFPKRPSVSFAARQTYSDGSVVDWNEHSATGSEPDHPAPTLTLTAATSAAPSATTTAASSTDSSTWPGVVGLVAGLVALLVSLAVLLTTRARARSVGRG